MERQARAASLRSKLHSSLSSASLLSRFQRPIAFKGTPMTAQSEKNFLLGIAGVDRVMFVGRIERRKKVIYAPGSGVT